MVSKFKTPFLMRSGAMLFSLLGLATGSLALTGTASAHYAPGYQFPLYQSSAGIADCLPRATGTGTFTTSYYNQKVHINVSGLLPATPYYISVSEGTSSNDSYTEIFTTNRRGSADINLQGFYNPNAPLPTPTPVGSPQPSTFIPAPQFDVSIAFASSSTPYQIGCEPGTTSPVTTTIGGYAAGLEVLSTEGY